MPVAQVAPPVEPWLPACAEPCAWSRPSTTTVLCERVPWKYSRSGCWVYVKRPDVGRSVDPFEYIVMPRASRSEWLVRYVPALNVT